MFTDFNILVAASNSAPAAIGAADFKCTGKHDELVLQQAIDACVRGNCNLVLANGNYSIDGFAKYDDGGPATAIRLPIANREISLLGQNMPYRSNGGGVQFCVSKEALESIDCETDVIRGEWTPRGIGNGSALHIENMSILLDNNQHPIRCLDLRRTDRTDIRNVLIYGFNTRYFENVPCAQVPVAVKGCIGMTTTDGSNNFCSNYTNVEVFGFDEGMQIGGEHVVLTNCGALCSRYGYTFGNYEFSCGFNHPITLVNCLDERNINFPLFNICGDHDMDGNLLMGLQEVTMVSFNMERNAAITPGGKLGDLMRETVPGTWRGNIGFTLQPAWNHINAPDLGIWEDDGSGSGFVTRNNTHKIICSSQERRSYCPTLGQQIFDADLNKLLVCINPAKRLWVDANGNPVE